MPLRISGPNLELPWSSSDANDRKLRKILLILFIPAAVIGAIIPFIDVPEPDRQTLEKVPPRLARVVLEEKEPPPTPPPTPQPTPEPELEKEEVVKEKPPAPEPETEPEPEPVVEQQPTEIQIEQARERAEEAIADVVDDLAAIQNEFDFSDLGSETLETETIAEAAPVTRSVIGDASRQSSGGITTSGDAPSAKTQGLGRQQTAKVESKKRTQAAKKRAERKVASSGQNPSRSQDEIRRVMDAAKSSVYRLYDRALRKDPSLEGNFKFELVIEPNGRVSSVKLVSSELDDPTLEQKLLTKIRSIRFEAKSVRQTKLEYNYTFLPG